jgi:hypothetical protein
MARVCAYAPLTAMDGRAQRRRRKGTALLLACAAGATVGSRVLAHDTPDAAPERPAESARSPSGEELAERWFEQSLGFDALEAYEARSGNFTIGFVVARKWGPAGQRMLVDVVDPPELKDYAFLFLPHPGPSLDTWIYLPFLRKVWRIPSIVIELPVPTAGVTFPIGALRRFRPGELEHERLPDQVQGGASCYVVESRPTDPGAGFERMRLVLSKESGVALETTFFRDGRELQRTTVAPEHVRQFSGRWLPVRRHVEQADGGGSGELVLRNLMVQPELPDRLFTQHNLRVQRFPFF